MQKVYHQFEFWLKEFQFQMYVELMIYIFLYTLYLLDITSTCFSEQRKAKS